MNGVLPDVPTTSERVRRITTFLERETDVEFALLFGSRAAGTARPDSDHDVAVWLAAHLDAAQRHQWLRRAYSELTPPDDLDLVVLNDAPPLLGHRALMGRVLVMRNRAAYVPYFVKTLARSNDEAYWRDQHDRARRQRLQEGRFGRP
jgi:predicted nucleotidyltransferase